MRLLLPLTSWEVVKSMSKVEELLELNTLYSQLDEMLKVVIWSSSMWSWFCCMSDDDDDNVELGNLPINAHY